MTHSRASFEALYRANQALARSDGEAEAAAGAQPGGSTIPLTEVASPLALEAGAELGLAEAAPELSGAGSFFERKPRDLGGRADPNQRDDENPYDSRALPRSGLQPPAPRARSPRGGSGR